MSACLNPKSCWTLRSLVYLLVYLTYFAVGALNAPIVGTVKSNSFVVEYEPVPSSSTYYVMLTSRHSSSSAKTFCVNETPTTISNLASDTIYDVTVKEAIDAEDSPSTELHTLPRPPTLRLSDPLSDSVFVFLQLTNYALVSQWTIRYRETGNDSTLQTVTSPAGQYYVDRLSGLAPDADYEVSARISQMSGTTNVRETESGYSSWYSFKTDSLSVYGSVVLTGETYTAQHAVEYSTEWNASLAIIEAGYASIDHNGISILRIQNSGGEPLVHYRIKVKDKTLPSSTDYTLTGSQFSNSLINNGDEAVGQTFISEAIPLVGYVLNYGNPGGCDTKAKRYMIVSPEDNQTFVPDLAGSAALGPEEEDSLIINTVGTSTELKNDDGNVIGTVSGNIVLGLTPRFLIKDCLKNQPTESLYTEYYQAQDLGGGGNITHIFHTTEVASGHVPQNEITYVTSERGTSVTLSVPALDKAIKYEILDGTNTATVYATLEANQLDASDILKMKVYSLTDGTTYNFQLRVTFRKHDGTNQIVDSVIFTVTADSTQCQHCQSNSTCSTTAQTAPSATDMCICIEGYNETEVNTCTKIASCDSSYCSADATCQEEEAVCDGNLAYSCSCNSGFTGNGTYCEDIDECFSSLTNDCDGNATCTNLPGSYGCYCNPGYSGNGTYCEDVDECNPPSVNDCDPYATCTNIPGGYGCYCNSGFSGIGTYCEDIDECAPPSTNDCDENATCTNMPGSYGCSCISGFIGNGTYCEGIDESEKNNCTETREPTPPTLDPTSQCYSEVKKISDAWEEKMRIYEEVHVARWKKAMDRYEAYLNGETNCPP